MVPSSYPFVYLCVYICGGLEVNVEFPFLVVLYLNF